MCSDDGKLGATHRLLLWTGQALVVGVRRGAASVAELELSKAEAKRLRQALTLTALRQLGNPKPSAIPDLGGFELRGTWPNAEQASAVYGLQPPTHAELFQLCRDIFGTPTLNSDAATVEATLKQLERRAEAMPGSDRRKHALLGWLEALPLYR
jgi:hypothetical protein